MEPQDLDPHDPRQRALAWVVVALLVLGFGACIAKGADNPADPRLVRSRVSGFGEIGIRILAPGTLPATAQRCALLAANEAQRSKGLMGVTDLKGYSGMLFRFSSDTQASFYMRNTPMPLSIAFFRADGSFAGAADMAPCGDRADCPLYSAHDGYRYALEVPQGQLGTLGIGPGSTLELNGACLRT